MQTTIELGKLTLNLPPVELDQELTLTITGRVSSVSRHLMESSKLLAKGDRTKKPWQRIELSEAEVTLTSGEGRDEDESRAMPDLPYPREPTQPPDWLPPPSQT